LRGEGNPHCGTRAEDDTFERAQAAAALVHVEYDENKSADTGIPFQDVLILRRLVGLDGHAKTDIDPT
jgi:hypothetical protein